MRNLELYFIRALQQKTMTKHLLLIDYGLTDKDVTSLLPLFDYYPMIQTVNLARNNIGSHGAELLSRASYIKRLNLRNNNITASGIKALCSNQRIRYLDISWNNLDDEAGKLLAQYAKQFYLNISDNPNLSINYFKLIQQRILNNRKNHIGIFFK